MNKSRPKEIKRDNILRTVFSTDIPTFHFSFSNKGSVINASYVIPWIFEGLMRKGKNDVPELAMAEKVDISRDKMHYTFYLRDCVWSDGVPVTAYDFEYAWKKLIDPNSPALTTSPKLFFPIKNVKNCIQGKCGLEEVGIVIIDDKTLSVELEYPIQYFLEILAHPFLFPAPKHVAENDPVWPTKPGFVCNGPFSLSKLQLSSEVMLKKNHMYWDQEHVYLDGIQIYICSDDQTALNMFEKGEIDWVGAPFLVMPYSYSHHVLKEEAKDANLFFFLFNTEKYPFSNEKFRKALAYGMDRHAITDNVFHDAAEPVMAALPLPLRLQNRPLFQDNNVVEAQKIFKEALQEIGETIDTLPKMEVLYNSESEFSKQMCLCAQDQWRRNLGLNISLKMLSGWSLFIDTMQSGHYQIALTGVAPPICDPLVVLESFKEKHDICNRSNWEDERFAQLIDKATYSINEIERTYYLQQAEEILIDKMPISPICSWNKRFAKHPRLKGETMSNLLFVDFKSAYFEE